MHTRTDSVDDEPTYRAARVRRRARTSVAPHTLHAIAFACFLSSGVHAQEYPTKPIRYMVPFGADGPTDTQARWVAQKITAALGQQVIVGNRPAAGGVPGTAFVAKAPGDGYTLLAANPGPLTVAPAITASIAYDTLRDFTPIILVAKSASVLVVHPSMPARSVKDFIAYAKANPGKINYGTPASVRSDI